MTTKTVTGYRNGDRCAHDYWPTACGICPAPAVAYNLQDELQRAEAGQPSTIPCPPWCEQAGNHPYEVPSVNSTTRQHRCEVPARDGAPAVVIWGYDLLEGDHREVDEPEIGPAEWNQSDVSWRKVPAFLEAMYAAARVVEEDETRIGFRVLTDAQLDEEQARMAAEPIDEEAALSGVASVLNHLAGINLPDSRDQGVTVDAPGGLDVTLAPQEDGVVIDMPAVPGGVFLDADAAVNLAVALLRMRVLNAQGTQPRSGGQ